MNLHCQTADEFRSAIPANLAAVEDFCMEVRHWAVSRQLPNRFAVELILREALINATIHGCGCDSSRRVNCVLRLRPGRLIIAVDDHGRGFDWRSAWARLPAKDACSGRGMSIIRQYAHRLRFNQRGNSLIIIKRLTREGPR